MRGLASAALALGLTALVGCASVTTTIPADAICWRPPPALGAWEPPTGPPAALATAPIDAVQLPWIEASGGRLPRLESDVLVRVFGDEAEIVLRQRYRNDRPRAIEAALIAPRPGGEVVASQRITYADRVLEPARPGEPESLPECDAPRPEGYIAELLDRDPALAETQWIPAIPAGAEIVVEQRTLRTFSHDAGELEVALAIDGAAAVEVEIEAAGPILAWRASTPAITAEVTGSRGRFTLARDPSRAAGVLVLRTRSAGAGPQGALFVGPRGLDGEGAFMLFIEPPHLDVDAVVGARELLFVNLSGPSVKAAAAVDAILATARPSDAVQVYQGRSAFALFAAPQPVHAASRDMVRASFLGDPRRRSSEAAPLATTLATQPAEGRRRHVFFVGDGSRSGRSTEHLRPLVRLVRELDPRSRAFVLGLYGAPGEPSLAHAGMTVTLGFNLPREGERVRRLLEPIVIDNLEIDWGDLEIDRDDLHLDACAGACSTLHASGPLRIFGRYRGEPPAMVSARGHRRGGASNLSIPVRHAGSEAALLHARWAEHWRSAERRALAAVPPRSPTLLRHAPVEPRADGAPALRGRGCRLAVDFEQRWRRWSSAHGWVFKASPPSRREDLAVADLSPLASEDARGARLGGMPSAESLVVVDGVPLAGSALTRVTPDESMGVKRLRPPAPPPRARVQVRTPELAGDGDPGALAATLETAQDRLAECFTFAGRETYRVRRRLRLRFARGEAGGAATLAVVAAEALPLAIGACLRETIDHVLPAGPVALEIPLTVRMRF